MKLRLFLLSAVLMSQCWVWSAETAKAQSPAQPAQSINDIFKKLKSECDNPQISNEPQRPSYCSTTENRRINYIAALKAAGATAKTQVRQELEAAKGEYKEMLVVAFASLGDDTSIQQSGQLMLMSDLPAVRVCAALELRRLKDKRLLEPFKQALDDPFKRSSGGCVGPEAIYPVRLIVSDALVDLGLSLEEVREIGIWWDAG